MNSNHKGLKKDGKFLPDDIEKFKGALDSFEDNSRIVVSFSGIEEYHTDSQRKKYFAMVKDISDYIGMDKDDFSRHMIETYCKEFKDGYIHIPTFSTLSKKRVSQLIEDIKNADANCRFSDSPILGDNSK